MMQLHKIRELPKQSETIKQSVEVIQIQVISKSFSSFGTIISTSPSLRLYTI